MSEEIKNVKMGDRTVAVASYWYNRNWLVKHLFPTESEGLDDAGLNQLGDEQGLPERCPADIWALNQVAKERRDIFVDMKLSFSSKTVDQIKDLADLDADSVPGAYQVAYLHGPTGSGKTMMARIYCATVGKAYFPILCTGDDELMLTKKLKGKKDLRASVRTEEMKKRAEHGVFETKDALLSFLRALRKNGAGTTLESHQEAFRKISQTDWDFTAEANGFPSDDSFSGIYVYGEAELAAKKPMGVGVNFDEYGLATGAVQADIRELFFDRSSDLTPGVNTVFFTTDNPAGEKYFNRTPIAGDNASRLQFRPVPLPGPDELVPDVCRSFGHKVEVSEANRRLLDDSFCSTTPGLEESRPSILKDSVGMDKDVIPPSKVMSGADKDDPVEFFKKALGQDSALYFSDTKDDKILSKFLNREQAINLSMRLVSFFCRIYKHVNDPTGPLSPKLYDHDSANSPEFSRRTLRSICTGIENRIRDVMEEIKDGGKINVPEQLALCVHKSVESYVLKQLDFRAAPTGTTVDGDSTRKAAREARPVISQVIRDSGLAWGDLGELFSAPQGGWVEEDLARSFDFSKPEAVAGIEGVCERARQLGTEMKPQDSLLRFKVGNESVYIPAGRDPSGAQVGIEAKMLYKLLDPNSEGLSPQQLSGMLEDYRSRGDSGGNIIFDSAIRMAELPSTPGSLDRLSDRFPKSETVELDFSAKWGGEISKTSAGSGIYILALGGGKAVAFDYDPSEKRGADKIGKAVGTVLDGAGEIVNFLSSAVVQGDAPGFSISGASRTHRAVNFLYPTTEPLRVTREGGEFVATRDIPHQEEILAVLAEGEVDSAKFGDPVLQGTDSKEKIETPRAGLAKIGKAGKSGAKKKQVYHKRDQSI
jgi:hypothetical protein